MTRQLSRNVNDTCDVCHKIPLLGWLYVCTEDATDYYMGRNVDEDNFLNPPVTKAVHEGHYSRDQIERLVLQKLDVRELAEELRTPVHTYIPRVTEVVVDSHGYDDSGDSEWIEDMNVDDVYGGSAPAAAAAAAAATATAAAQFGQPRMIQYRDLVPMTSLHSAARPCIFKCCHACRPVYSENAWASLDAVCSNAPSQVLRQLMSDLEQSNRRIVDADVVRSLGVRHSV